MNRRFVLKGASALAGAAALATLTACVGKTQTQLQSDVELFNSGLSAILTAISVVPGLPIPPAVITQAQNVVNGLEADSALIASGLAPDLTVAQRFSTGVQVLSDLLKPYFAAAQPVANLVNAVASLAKQLLVEFGVVKAAARLDDVATMSPAQARATIRAAASR